MPLANVSRPMGFMPYSLNGKMIANVNPRPVPATRTASAGGNASTDLAIGDAYAIDVNGNAYRAGPNDVVAGIVVGFRFVGNATIMLGGGPISIDYITGTMGGTGTNQVAVILGCEDQTVDFVVQADTFAATNVGGRFNLTDAAPDATYGQSRQKLNVGGGVGVQFEAIDIAQSTGDNAYGANARVVVRLLQALNI